MTASVDKKPLPPGDMVVEVFGDAGSTTNPINGLSGEMSKWGYLGEIARKALADSGTLRVCFLNRRVGDVKFPGRDLSGLITLKNDETGTKKINDVFRIAPLPEHGRPIKRKLQEVIRDIIPELDEGKKVRIRVHTDGFPDDGLVDLHNWFCGVILKHHTLLKQVHVRFDLTIADTSVNTLYKKFEKDVASEVNRMNARKAIREADSKRWREISQPETYELVLGDNDSIATQLPGTTKPVNSGPSSEPPPYVYKGVVSDTEGPKETRIFNNRNSSSLFEQPSKEAWERLSSQCSYIPNPFPTETPLLEFLSGDKLSTDRDTPPVKQSPPMPDTMKRDGGSCRIL